MCVRVCVRMCVCVCKYVESSTYVLGMRGSYILNVSLRVWPNDKLISIWIIIGSLVMVYMF